MSLSTVTQPAAPPSRAEAALDFRARIPALDGLRALAVTLVFVQHFGGGLHGHRLMRIVGHVR